MAQEGDITTRLLELAEGRLNTEAAAALRAQLTPAQASELAQVERIIALMRADQTEDAPDYVVNRALRLMRPLMPAAQPSILERITAVLRFDSAQAPLAAGVRSGVATSRQMLFHAGDHELDLRITPSDGRWTVVGQVLGPSSAGSVMLANAQQTYHAELNALSEFRFQGVSSSRYMLQIQLGQLAITVPDIDIA